MVLAILQARMSSTRLPGKVLKPLMGAPMLLRQVERILRARSINKLVIATSDLPSDDPLAQLCEVQQLECFRGSLEDVLDRFYQAALRYHPAHVMRLTADCPLTDPAVLDQLVDLYMAGDYDYANNSLEPSYPDGLDAEVMRFSVLEEAWKEARLPSDREHVTPFIRKHTDRYKLGILKNHRDLSHLRWTVDEPQDFELVTRVYEALYPSNPTFDSTDVLAYLEKAPDLLAINAQFERNAGYKKSLSKDLILPDQKNT